MKKIVFILLMCFFAADVFAESFDDTLSKARRLVESKQYDLALSEYEKIKDGLKRDTGLLIERARVYAYANRHKQAIALFEEIKKLYPKRTAEFICELAREYRWNADMRKAREQYDLALRLLPDNKTVLEEKADFLAANEDLEGAIKIYRYLIELDGSNISARNNYAKMLVWQGYHRRGIKYYQEILKKYPDDLDALEGLAFAFHWDGNDVRVLEVLEKLRKMAPQRKEADKLYYQIKGAQSPFVKQYNRYTKDSNFQTVVTDGWRIGQHLSDSLALNAIYEYLLLHKKNAQDARIGGHRTGLGFEKYFSAYWQWNTFAYRTDLNRVDFDPVTVNSWVTFRPDDIFRFDLSFDRETFDDNDALANKVVTQGPALSIDVRPDRFWFFNLRYKRSYYSDTNEQNQISAKIERRLNQKPYIKAYYNFYYSSLSEPQLNHGYFNPASIHSHTLGLYSGVDVTKKLFVEGQAAGGYELQHKSDVNHKKSNHPVFEVKNSWDYRLLPDWQLSLTGEYFTTWPDRGQRCYCRKVAYMSLTYNFGAGHTLARGGSRSADNRH